MKTEKKGNIYIFITLTLVTLAAIVYFTADETTVTALMHFRLSFFLILFFLWVLIYSFDSLAFFFMVLSSGERIPPAISYRTSALKTFFMMVTPVGMGVTPALIYYLSSNKISTGKSSSLVLTKVMINALWILSGAILSFFLNYTAIMRNTVLFVSFIITIALHVVFISMVVLLILFPYHAIGFLTGISRILSKLKIIKKIEGIKYFLVHEAFAARKSFRLYFKKHIGTFLAAVLSNGLSYFFTLSVLFFVLKGLGQDVTFAETSLFTALMVFIIGILPTPGGSGLAEILFIILLSGRIEVAILGVAVVIWRLFIYYISAGIGLSISIKYLSKFLVGRKKKS